MVGIPPRLPESHHTWLTASAHSSLVFFSSFLPFVQIQALAFTLSSLTHQEMQRLATRQRFGGFNRLIILALAGTHSHLG